MLYVAFSISVGWMVMCLLEPSGQYEEESKGL